MRGKGQRNQQREVTHAWHGIRSATEYEHVPSRSSSCGRNMPYYPQP